MRGMQYKGRCLFEDLSGRQECQIKPPAGRRYCKVHEPDALLLPSEAERWVDFSSLKAIRRTMEEVTKAILRGSLDPKIGSAATGSTKLAAQTFVMESELENHADKRLASMSDEEFEKLVAEWREELRTRRMDS